MTNLKEGFCRLKNISWLQSENLMLIAVGLVVYTGYKEDLQGTVSGEVLVVMVGYPWLLPVLFYRFIRVSKANAEVFAHKDARLAFLLLFLIVELCMTLPVILRPEFLEAWKTYWAARG